MNSVKKAADDLRQEKIDIMCSKGKALFDKPDPRCKGKKQSSIITFRNHKFMAKDNLEKGKFGIF